MKFVTFNIRLDNHQDGIYNFDCRKEPILRKLRDEKPDILCFQEVLPHALTWLRENLPEYYVVGCGRGPEFDDEASAIACRKDSVELMGFETFWLSPTPHLPGSRYAAQSPCPGFAPWPPSGHWAGRGPCGSTTPIWIMRVPGRGCWA